MQPGLGPSPLVKKNDPESVNDALDALVAEHRDLLEMKAKILCDVPDENEYGFRLWAKDQPEAVEVPKTLAARREFIFARQCAMLRARRIRVSGMTILSWGLGRPSLRSFLQVVVVGEGETETAVGGAEAS